MAIKNVELLVCDDCNCISTGNPEDKIHCMECGKIMARVKFFRQPTTRAVDSPEPCGDYTPAFLIPGSPCLNCDADAASH